MPVMKIRDEVSIVDREPENTTEEIFYDSNEFLEEEDSEEENKKDLGSELDDQSQERFYNFHNQMTRRQLRYKQKRKANRVENKPREMLEIKGKTHFLMLVNATDCIKDKVSGRGI